MPKEWLIAFANDSKVHLALILVAVDFILGVAAALKTGNFRMAYVAEILKNDILGKLLPYFALYSLALVAGSEDIVIPGIDFGFIAGSAFALLVAALGGSILNSVKELMGEKGTQTIETALAGDE